MAYEELSWVLCLALVAVSIGHTLSAPPSLDSPQDSRIINGTVATLENTKHQVSIRSRVSDDVRFGMGHLCGGSLISENVVLSAAHCFQNQDSEDGTFLPDKNFIAVMGNLDRFEKNNNTLVFDILKMVKYNEIFDLGTYDQDIVLLILNGSVPADHPTIQPIILNDGPLNAGTMCQVTGWGITEGRNVSDVLLTVDVPFIPFEVCRNYSSYEDDSIHEGMLCAGYFEGKHDACQGDSGGPLVCQGHQAGIVSWGNGCANVLKPGVYTDVAFYKKWILEKVSENNGTLPKFGENSSNGDGDSGNGGNGGIGGADGGGGGAMSLSNRSMLLVALLGAFNLLLSKL